MENDIIEITEETKNKLREFDEQEAYFLLCEIFSHAQATKDYAKFQSDLTEWKKRFPVDLFSEAYKSKIKYMLSKEFLDTVLKNFVAFDELSKKDPSKGLEKLRKVLDRAEKHKDAKQLDKDLDNLYAEYPLKFLKEKYPHLISQLLSKSNRTRILEKFDSSLAFKELSSITEKPQNYRDVDEFKNTIAEWQKLYPTVDFNDKYKNQVEQLLSETLDASNLEKLFPVFTELDLTAGEVIPLELKDTVKNISLVSKDALYEFFKIVDKNRNDINSLFDWTCKYNRYINSFDSTIKAAIVDNLMSRYAYELPPVNTIYQIPKMNSGAEDLLSLSDFKSIDDTKKQVVLQLLGILSTGKELTQEDSYRLDVINANVQKVKMIEKAKIEPKLDLFMEKFPEEKLTPSDAIYLEPNSATRVDVSVDNDADLTLHNDENDNIVVEKQIIHATDENSFKDTLKITETLEKVNSTSGATGSADAGSTAGGSAVSISSNEITETREIVESTEDEKKEVSEEEFSIPQIPVTTTIEKDIPADSSIKAVIMENEPEIEEQESTDTPELEFDNTPNTANIIEDVQPIEEPAVEETPELQEDIPHKNPVQNFFTRFLRREKTDTFEDDERDDR